MTSSPLVRLVLLAAASVPSSALATPPLSSPIQVVALLKKATPAQLPDAVDRVQQACRGRLRRTLRDHPALVAEVRRRASAGPIEARKVVLDTFRCFSPARFRSIVTPLFTDADPAMVAYAAEVGARTEDAALVGPMLAALAARRSGCLKPGLDAADVEVCVWLSYAPGACLRRASAKIRTAAAEAVVPLLAAPYAKVREVSVETVAAARQKRFAPSIAELVAKEKAKAFADLNDPALVARFEKRRRALTSAE